MTRTKVACALALAVIGAAVGCAEPPATALEHLVESRRLTAEILVQFTKAADAANRSVMADTDEASVAFSREAEEASGAVETNVHALAPVLESLRYREETGLLEEFRARFNDYRALDRDILQLAVLNTNLKAQRLSFGEGQKAADAFGKALETVAPQVAGESWHVKALVATAMSSVRQVQVLQAPHIAEPDDAVMARLEAQMTAATLEARTALKTMEGLVAPASRSALGAASAALDEFTRLNRQIIDLSRHNSNVRSLALSLGRKRTLTAACDDSLRALQKALAARGFAGTR